MADVSEILIGSIFIGRWMKNVSDMIYRVYIPVVYHFRLPPPIQPTQQVYTVYTLYIMSLTFLIHLPMKMEPIRRSETSAIKTKTPGNYPKRNITIETRRKLKNKNLNLTFILKTWRIW